MSERQVKKKQMLSKQKMILNWRDRKYKAICNECDEEKWWEVGKRTRNSKLITGYILIEKPLFQCSTVSKHLDVADATITTILYIELSYMQPKHSTQIECTKQRTLISVLRQIKCNAIKIDTNYFCVLFSESIWMRDLSHFFILRQLHTANNDCIVARHFLRCCKNTMNLFIGVLTRLLNIHWTHSGT